MVWSLAGPMETHWAAWRASLRAAETVFRLAELWAALRDANSAVMRGETKVGRMVFSRAALMAGDWVLSKVASSVLRLVVEKVWQMAASMEPNSAENWVWC